MKKYIPFLIFSSIGISLALLIGFFVKIHHESTLKRITLVKIKSLELCHQIYVVSQQNDVVMIHTKTIYSDTNKLIYRKIIYDKIIKSGLYKIL